MNNDARAYKTALMAARCRDAEQLLPCLARLGVEPTPEVLAVCEPLFGKSSGSPDAIVDEILT